MKLYSDDKNYKLYHGNMLDMAEVIEPNSIDAIVTDPPYELNFMNRKWDNTGIAFQKETWKKCYDVLKPGGHMLVFGGCYDEYTEYLTKTGWKLIKDAKMDDEVVTLNPDTYGIEFHKPNEVVKFPYKGDMYHFQTNKVDLMVTANHKMYVSTLGRKSNPYRLERADTCYNKAIKMKKNAINDNKDIEYFTLPSVEKSNGHYSYITKEIKIPMNIWLKFFGLYIAQGSATITESYKVKLSHYVKEDLDVIEKELSPYFNICRYDDIGVLNINNKELALYLQQFGKATIKHLPKWLNTLSMKQIKLFIQWYLYGDGDRKSCKDNLRWRGYTSSKQLADDFQELALYGGISADISVRPPKTVYIKERKVDSQESYIITFNIVQNEPAVYYRNNKLQKIVEKSYRDDFVYCVEVPNHIIYVRRNGKSCWCGNTRTFHRIACAIEDAGFEIRDTIMWLYGCLSEDTEILTSNGFKNFHKITKDDVIKVYDIENGIYKWEKPERWNVYSVDNEVCYRIKSNDTDQLVSKNHRCLIEQKGKLVFKYAENLNENELIPIVLYDGNDCSVYQTTLATITKEEYSGIIYCPTVSTGCFVARRNGKVFITGNSGFPKSMNIGLAIDKKNGVDNRTGIRKHGNCGSPDRHLFDDDNYKWVDNYEERQAQNEWKGYGTQLKPSYEPIIVCRKPCEGSIVDNVMKYGVGGINIDECRVPISKDDIDMINAKSSKNPTDNYNRNESKKYGDYALNIATTANEQGRFPANTILTYDESDFDEVCGGFPNSGSGNGGNPYNYAGKEYDNKDTSMFNGDKPQSPSNYNDSGSASRYFYCAKASKRDRDEGLEEFEDYVLPKNGSGKRFTVGGSKDISLPRKNVHPTVKPTSLMQYLVRLVTPKGGTVLDPFNGSGSTGKACMYENADRNANYKYIGIELTEEYLPISKARIEFAEKNPIMDYDKKTKIENKTSRNKINDNELESIFDL